MASLKSGYLWTYNMALAIAWSYVIYLSWTHQSEQSGEEGSTPLWNRVQFALKLAQSAAILEVLHAAFGIVRSPAMVTATQVASRLWIVWGILNAAPLSTTTKPLVLLDLPGPLPRIALSFHTLIFAWGITEIIRYSFFAFKEAGLQPFFLLWMRYSGFIILYPLGVSSELAMVFLALPYLKESRKWCYDMPNALNIGFEYWIACLLGVAAYIPGFPQLYFYMVSQRKKVLRRVPGTARRIATAKKVD